MTTSVSITYTTDKQKLEIKTYSNIVGTYHIRSSIAVVGLFYFLPRAVEHVPLLSADT